VLWNELDWIGAWKGASDASACALPVIFMQQSSFHFFSFNFKNIRGKKFIGSPMHVEFPPGVSEVFPSQPVNADVDGI
jgi:hypothetical protein